MDNVARQRLEAELDSIRDQGLYKTERIITTPQSSAIRTDGRPRGAELLREQLSRPRRPSGHHRSGQARARHARLRPRIGALHLRHAGPAQGARGNDREILRHRRHDPLHQLLRRQRRPVRDDPQRRGRGHLGRAEPRLDHRRHPPVQGRAPSLRERRHGRARKAPRRNAGQAHAPDRDRRRVLDGRLHRQARRDRRSSRRNTTRC